MHFNDGTRWLLNLIGKCSIEHGHFAVMGFAKYDALRVARMNTKGSTSSKKQRKRLRAQRKGWEEKNDTEVTTLEIFDMQKVIIMLIQHI